MARGSGPQYRCFVRGLAWRTSDSSLQEAFKVFGNIIECKIIQERETGRSKGFGFITFGDEASMRNAIESMNGKELDGRTITVHEAQSRNHGGSGGGYNLNRGSRSGSYGGNGDRGYGGSNGYFSGSNSRSDGSNWRRSSQ